MTMKTIYEIEEVDRYCLTLTQLSDCTRMEEPLIIELVETEVLCPVRDDRAGLLFHPDDLSRLSRAARLCFKPLAWQAALNAGSVAYLTRRRVLISGLWVFPYFLLAAFARSRKS